MADAKYWDERFELDRKLPQGGRFAGARDPSIVSTVTFLQGLTGTGRRALDLGCGRGRHTVWLALQGWEVTGLDFSAVGLAHARETLDDQGLHATLVQSDFTAWNPQPESFDLIVAAYIHLQPGEQRDLWRKIATALTPGGYFLTVSHHPENTAHGPKNPEVLYTPEDVAAAFGKNFHAETVKTLPCEATPGRVDTVVLMQKAAGTPALREETETPDRQDY